jgi:tetratricopeptide (TPR) repeat protein
LTITFAQCFRCFVAAIAIAGLCLGVPVQAKQLSRSTHQSLTEARELMGEDKYEAALRKLEKLLAKVGKRDYEKALTLQTLGYAYAGIDRDRDAIDAFERSLEMDALPDAPTNELQNRLARLYTRIEQYEKAYDYLQDWFAQIEKPGAGDYALKANILAQLDRTSEAIEAIRTAIERTDSPKEQHYQLLVSLQYRSERFAPAMETLQDMLAQWPDQKQYWTQLASVYLQLERNQDAHAVMKLAYRKGLLESETELLRLARIGLSIGVPAKTAELLEQELKRGRIEANEDHWALAGQAWAQAREWERAIHAYAEAAKRGNAGKYHMQRAHMFTRLDDWQSAIEAARKALKDPDLESPGKAHILIGRGYLELGKHDKAVAAFNNAVDDTDSARQARQWRQYAERRKS